MNPDAIKDGGPAFPFLELDGAGAPYQQNPGMTLRDYFATHSVQPGCGEIASVAGLTYRVGGIWSDAETRLGSFDEWFNALPLNERLYLFARVKYAMADAMLRAREAA